MRNLICVILVLNVTFVVCFETKKIASCCLVAYLCMVEKHN